MTGHGLKEFVETKICTPYVKHMKGAMLKPEIAKSLLDIFPKDYDSDLSEFTNKVCVDNDGLVQWYTNKPLSAEMLYYSAGSVLPMGKLKDAPIGALLYKFGEVGVYIGNDTCIYADEKNGVIKVSVEDTDFTHILIMKDFEY